VSPQARGDALSDPVKTAVAETSSNIGKRSTLSEGQDFVKVLYQGEPGSGKTTAAAHLAKLGKVIWIAAEAGLKRRPMVDLGIPVDRIEIHRDITFEGLEGLFTEMRDTLMANPTAYAGVVWDSFSEAQNILLEEKAKTLLISQQEYGINTQQMTLLLRHFTDLPCHVVYITHTKRDEDEDGQTIYRPAVTPKVGGTLLGYVDVTCYTMAVPRTDSEEPDYIGLFRAHGKYRAKDRFGCLPPRLVSPTMDRVVAYVNGTFRREAQLEADRGGDMSIEGLDGMQYEYRQRLAVAKVATAAKEA